MTFQRALLLMAKPYLTVDSADTEDSSSWLPLQAAVIRPDARRSAGVEPSEAQLSQYFLVLTSCPVDTSLWCNI